MATAASGGGFNKLTIDDVDLKDKRVLMSIVGALPTIMYAMEKGARAIILINHRGRPDGKVDNFSMKSVVNELNKLLGKEVQFLSDCVGLEVEKACANPKPGSVILLENLRFHIEEEGKVEEPDGSKIKADAKYVEEFQASLSKLGDVYINDAFGTAHRAYSSMVGVKLKQKDILFFRRVINSPRRPFLAILGGAKVADKIPLIECMLDKVNEMIIGGGIAFTFLKVLYNMEIGKSLFDEEGSKIVPKLMEKAKAKKVTITLPVDFVTGDKFDEKATVGLATVAAGIKAPELGLDIGPQSIKLFTKVVMTSTTIIWNGSLGVTEWASFSKGTERVLSACVDATKEGATVIIDATDASYAAEKWKVDDNIPYEHKCCDIVLKMKAADEEEVPSLLELEEKFLELNFNNNAVAGKRGHSDVDSDVEDSGTTGQHSSSSRSASGAKRARCKCVQVYSEVTKDITPEDLVRNLFNPSIFQNVESPEEIYTDRAPDRNKAVYEPIKSLLNKTSFDLIASLTTEKTVATIDELQDLVGEHISHTAENWLLRKFSARHTCILVSVNNDCSDCGVIGFSSNGLSLDFKDLRQAVAKGDVRVYEYKYPLVARAFGERIDLAMTLVKSVVPLPRFHLEKWNCECFVNKLLINTDNMSIQAHKSLLLWITPSFVLYGRSSKSSKGIMR